MDPVEQWLEQYRRVTSGEPDTGLERRVLARLHDGDGAAQARRLVFEPLPAMALVLLALVIGMLMPAVTTPPQARGVELSILIVDAPLLPSTIFGRLSQES